MMNSRSAAVAVLLSCLGVARGEAGAVPGATLIDGTTLCVVDGWEYAPRWSTPNNGFNSPSLEDCAADCEADAVCTGATWITNAPEGNNNCWFKNWPDIPPPPCLPGGGNLEFQAIIDPMGVACGAIEYLPIPTLACDDEAMLDELPEILEGAPTPEEADAPAATVVEVGTTTDLTTLAAVTPPYSGFVGYDYSPGVDNLVVIEDLTVGGGLITATAAECAEECNALAGCNSASYYGDLPMLSWPGGDNCYLKALDGCMLPDDAPETGDATIFLIGGADCEGMLSPSIAGPEPLMLAPAVGTGPTAAAAPAPAAGPIAPVLGFADSPVPTLDGGATGPASAPVPASTRAIDLDPEAGSEIAPDPSSDDVVASGAVGALPSLFAMASVVFGAVLLM